MEELLELRRCIEAKNYDQALEIVGELEEMSKEDKLNKIYSYAVILLIHLIKQEVENRTTRSWNVSIRNAVREINRVNRRHNAVLGVPTQLSGASLMSDCDKTRRKSGGYYATKAELIEILKEAMPSAVDRASLEVQEGLYESKDLMLLFDGQMILDRAFELINPTNP